MAYFKVYSYVYSLLDLFRHLRRKLFDQQIDSVAVSETNLSD